MSEQSNMLLRPSKCVLNILRFTSVYLAEQLGSTTVGVRTRDGVVLGVEKRTQSPLLESSSVEKIMEIDRHLGCAMSGVKS